MKKILVLGGTQMLGRDFVEHCLKNESFSISIANRSITNPELFNNQCQKITIDRTSHDACNKLSKEKYDVVVDFSCYNVNFFYNTIRNLKYDKYFLISTTATRQKLVTGDIKHPMYGYAIEKKRVENYIYNNDELRKRITIIRPCIVYGKHDYTDRFVEIENKIYHKDTMKEVVNSPYYINVKDLTNKIIDAIKKSKTGTFYADGGGYKIFPEENKNILISTYNTPFNHVVIDNLFNQQTYASMCKKFPEFTSKTKPYKDIPGATSNYEAYIHGLNYGEVVNNVGYELFASKYLQNFVEESFNIKTNRFIAPSTHYHKAPSKDGFVHSDYNIVSFGRKNGEFVCLGGATYCDDIDEDNIPEEKSKVVRSVALLYYLCNKTGPNSVGGGTGIFDRSHNLIKNIEPKNNRLFMFEISNDTYHSFVGANFNRSAVVSWFHSDVAYHAHRNWKKYNHGKGIERWGNSNKKMWPIEKDPDYKLYFDEKGNPL